jgi:DNA-binding NarL/FixJ family response regulator
MDLTPEQQLRRDLLLRMLERFEDANEALEAAVALEKFILEGAGQSPARRSSPPSPKGGGAGDPAASGGGSRDPSGTPSQESARRSLAHNSKKRRWTKDEETQLRRMWGQGTAVKDIAQELGRSRMGIRHRAHSLGLSRPSPARGA